MANMFTITRIEGGGGMLTMKCRQVCVREGEKEEEGIQNSKKCAKKTFALSI